METVTVSETVAETTTVQGETEQIIENGESSETGKSDDGFATPTVQAPVASSTPTSTPDLTPSRRSSRKKQSTFSSDFEYYIPGGRKTVAADEGKQDVLANKSTPKGEKKGQSEESDQTGISGRKVIGMQRKVAVRTKKGKASKVEEEEDEDDDDDDEEEEEDFSSPEPQSKKAKPKVTVMKQKGIRGQKKKIGRVAAENKEKRNKLNKTLKRKKAAIKNALAKSKKAKIDKNDMAEEMSDEDEEETTPISQLKAQIAASKPSQSKIRVKELANSPLAKNLMHKLKQVSGEVLSSPESLGVAKKRKLTSSKEKEVDDDEDIPLKKLQVENAHKEKEVVVKREPIPPGLVKRSPPVDTGLVKRTPSEIALKLSKKNGASGSGDNADSVKKDFDQKKISLLEPVRIKEEGETVGESHKVKKSVTIKEEGPEIKKPGNTAKSVKKEVKKEVKPKVKEEGGKVLSKTKGKDIVKKASDVIKTVQRSITTADGRVIDATVKVYRDGKKVMTVNGKEKILNPGKGKEGAVSLQSADKNESHKKGKSAEPKKSEVKSKGEEVKSKGEEGKTPSKVQKKKSAETSQNKSSQNVDDLLKRGLVVKKKSHQPFGNKNIVSKHKTLQDTRGETTLKSSGADKKVTPPKGKEKERKRSHEGERKKEIERRRSSESSKSLSGRERSHSSESKGERRKSAEGGRKVASGAKAKEEEETKEDGPPPLVPVSAMTKSVKHKHNKPEHEVPLDATMNDLFKPDGMIVLDTPKKDDGTALPEDNKQTEHDPESPVKPQNLPNVLIEHGYSKPSSPVHKTSREELSVGLHQQDFDSVSHNTSSVRVDANLPDQFMEESGGQEEEVIADNHPVLSDSIEGQQQTFPKEKPGDRISILESLDTELKEGGSEFLIVGQVEIGRPAITKTGETTSEIVATPDKSTNTSQKDISKKAEEPKIKTSEQKNTHKTKKDSGAEIKKKNEKHKEEAKVDEDDDDDVEEDYVDDEDDDDWEPNDPNTLYCICQKPHGNRFMICCDKCEEWYHGSCVNISKARGKEMEDNEEEYICIVCQKGETPSKPAVEVPSTKSNEKTPPSKPKVIHKCVGRKCGKTPRPGSVYCSNECIMSHAQDSLKVIREEQHKRKIQEKLKQSSSKDSKSVSSSKISSLYYGDTVPVVETETGKIIQGPDAPTHKSLRQWLEDHPSFQVLNGSKHRSSSSSSSSSSSKDSKHRDSPSSKSGGKEKHHEKDPKSFYSDKSRRDSKESVKKVDGERRRSSSSSSSSKPEGSSASTPSSKSADRNDDGPNQVRLNVRTALRDSLSVRANEADDIMLSSTEIKNLALTIEEELFAYFNDTGHKYRTKYRSLIFNIKDQKNKGLFRKILTGKVKPSKLVQMSTEELASRELAKWREKESKHQLEMIEQTEKEALKESMESKHVRKKTHKGEIEVEEEDLSILETHLEEKKDSTAEMSEENIQVPVIDTTDQHRAHLFDLNCKVCTGRIVPGPEEQALAKKQVTFSLQASSTKIISDDEQPTAEPEMNDFDKAEEIVREAMRTVQKTEADVASSSLASPPPPPAEEMPLSPKSELPPSPQIKSTKRESTSTSSTPSSSSSSTSAAKKVVVRSPDSALQSGLEVKGKFTPTGPLLWKGFVSMLDVAKFFTSAYRVSGPTDHITIPDTIHIMGRISPDHMWDYLSKIRQAGSKDLTVVRFIPGSDDEKVAYVHLYSYLNSRSRCGVANNPTKHIKDFYVVPLASHSKIPRTLLPFDGPGLEENRPHMLIGILVQQRGKHSSESDTSSKSSKSDKSIARSSPTDKSKSSSKHKQHKEKSSNNGSSSSSSSSSKKTVVNRDPRLAKLAAKKEPSPQASPANSNSSSASSNRAATPQVLEDKVEEEEIYEPEYVPMPVKAKATEPIAEYVPTAKKNDLEASKEKKERKTEDNSDKHQHHTHSHHHSHNQHHQQHSHHLHHHHQEEKSKIEDDSEPYSPGKEAEPYSPSREAEADEPYDPGDESLMDESGIPISSTLTPTTMPVSSTVTTTEEVIPSTASVVASQAETKESSSSDTSFSIDECVEKMACSNNPSEISSLMVAALSRASTPEEQQKLLVDLTKRVEERKLQLAHLANKEEGSSQATTSGKPVEEGSVSSTSTTTEFSTTAVSPDNIALPTGNVTSKEESSSNSKGTFSVSSSTEASLSIHEMQVKSGSLLENSSLLVSSTSSSEAQSETSRIHFSFGQPAKDQGSSIASQDHSSDLKAESSQSEDQQAESSSIGKTSVTELPFLGGLLASSKPASTPKPANSDIPDALKALIEDVKGNTESSSSLKRRRKILLKRESEEKEDETEKAIEDKNSVEVGCVETVTQWEPASSEAERKLQDELEARKILEELNETEKAIGLPSGGRKEEVASTTSVKVSQSEEVKDIPSSSDKVPTIDELLEKLKREGFKFSLDKSSTSNTVVTSPSSTSILSSTTTSTTIFTTASETPPVPSSTTDLNIMDVDLRTSTLPSVTNSAPISVPAPSDTVSMTTSATDVEVTPFPPQDSDERKQIPSTSGVAELDQDDRDLYQDRDERMFTAKPKQQLDPLAFPPAPVDSHPHPHPADPRTHASHQYPPHQADPFKTQPIIPKGQTQAPSPGTEFKESTEVADIDMRNVTRPIPPLPPEQAPPPLPPQPPPPLPPLPGNHRDHPTHYPHYPPHDIPTADVDFRSHEHHHPPPQPPPPFHHYPHHHHPPPQHHPRHPPPHHADNHHPPSHHPDNWYHDHRRDTDYRGYRGRGRGGPPPFRRH